MSATASPRVGSDFGDYRIDALLGKGAMGVVYRAWQRRMNRAVALKVLPAHLADDPQYRARFAREAAALARLDSPHVVQIYDHGELDGSLYLAMQLVQGPDLGRVLATAPLSPRRALRIADQVATALGDGHAVGVVHRDVKPSNVLMRPRPEHDTAEDDDFAYLADFGIARSTADAPIRTETGGIIGTLSYMAPERIDGKPATAASDVYALGCLLWTSLVGSPPYQGTQSQVMMGHLHAPVRRLDGSDRRTALVNDLLAATMAKDPTRRPTTAAVRRQIREILADAGAAPFPSRRASTLPDPAQRLRRRVWPVAALAAVALAAGLGWVLLVDPARTAEQRLAEATPTGLSCTPTTVPEDTADAGGLAQAVCDVGTDVGELRLVAVAQVDDGVLGTVAGQPADRLPADGCPDGLPARDDWERDGRGGTLLCFVLGPNVRYAWSYRDEDVVAVLDGAVDRPYPQDLAAVEAFFAELSYPVT